MAISTYKTYLMHKNSVNVWEKFIDIKSFPDIGGEPSNIEVTTLSDYVRKYIRGLMDVGETWDFEANYTHSDYAKCNALTGKQEQWAIWFGATGEPGNETPTGSEGRFSFAGDISARIPGGGVNEAVNMTVSIVPSSVIKDETQDAA